MMTQQLEVSILAAPLAAIDRRTLSQAWYSALRLVRDMPAPAAPRARPDRNATVAGSARSKSAFGTVAAGDAAPRIAPAGARRLASLSGAAGGASGVRRVRLTPLARAIGDAFADSRAPARRATFSMGRGGARIHVVLQTNGARTTLVALCRPEIRTIVARALNEARLALAARGIELCAKRVRPCS
jgi:hypothetical protein